MQLRINTEKLPEGFTLQEVYDVIEKLASGHIGEHETGSDDLLEEKAVLSALVNPSRVEDHLNVGELNYLRMVGSHGGEINEMRQGWLSSKRIRAKLERLGLGYHRHIRSTHICPEYWAFSLTPNGTRLVDRMGIEKDQD